MGILILSLFVLWAWSAYFFVRWRVRILENGGEPVDALSDWVIQLYCKGTALVLLVAILLLIR